MQKEVVSIDVAQSEINKWLDYKKVNEGKRESNSNTIESLVSAVQVGKLRFDDTKKTLVQTLDFPLGKNQDIKDLEYQSRIGVGKIHRHLKGLKSDDADGRLLAYVSALTNQPKGIIGEMDTEDYTVGQSIAIFFL
ncbi:MAG: hypothetical protein JKY43_10195 [Phycisphaerales bacterium]|nr:hypothetical protein [Phycisphaerales bacterium]